MVQHNSVWGGAGGGVLYMYHLYTAPRNIIGLQIAIKNLNEKENHDMKIPHLSTNFFFFFKG